jgi:predicted site-specific integrase-resolvase
MPNDDRIDRVRTRKETAERLRISVRTLSRMERRGEIQRIRISHRVYGYRDSAIEKFLEERTGSA